jgi:hypothetical protein
MPGPYIPRAQHLSARSTHLQDGGVEMPCQVARELARMGARLRVLVLCMAMHGNVHGACSQI